MTVQSKHAWAEIKMTACLKVITFIISIIYIILTILFKNIIATSIKIKYFVKRINISYNTDPFT